MSEGRTGTDARRWLALVLLCLSGFMVVLDSQIVIVALPSMERELGVTPGSGQWVLSAYMIAFGGLLLFGGRLSDLLGRRRMFIVGTVLFLVSSLGCGLAWSVAILICARVVQGMSAALMAPTALAILMGLFADGPERNKALACWTGVGGIGATAALLIGGPVTTFLGWQWIFYLNIPVAVVMVVFAPVLFPESRAPGPRSYDSAGALTSTLGVMLLLGAIAWGPSRGWLSGPVVGAVLGAVVVFVVFVVVERRCSAPLVPLRVFRSRLFVGGTLAMVLFAMATVGMSISVTTYAQRVLGYTPLQFGVAMVPLTVAAVVGAFVGQSGVSMLGFRPVAVGAAVAMTMGLLLLSFAPVHGTYVAHLFPGLLLFGLGLGAGPVAAVSSALSTVDNEFAGVASGAANAGFQLGGALGAAAITAIAVANGAASTDPVSMTAGLDCGLTADLIVSLLCLITALVLLGPSGGSAAAGQVSPVPDPAEVDNTN